MHQEGSAATLHPENTGRLEDFAGSDSAAPDELHRRANLIRISAMTMTHRAGLGHTGGDLSAADILATLYGVILRLNPAQPEWPQRDRFILSKGHCAAALYAVLSMRGFFP